MITTELTQAQLVLDILQANYSRTSFPATLDSIMSGTIIYYQAFNDNNQMIGISGLKKITPALIETVKTVVLSEYRGKGYGQKISELIEVEAVKLGAKKVMTTIYAWNHAMIGIKLKQGYKIEGFHPDHEAPGFDEYSLGKVIKC